jgi:flagellar hook-associated protein 2
MASISLLGLGSDNMLNADLITDMKEADTTVQIKPLEEKLSTIDVKFTKIDELKAGTNALNDIASTLGNEMTYLQVNAFTSNSGVAWITAEDGVSPQNFSLNVSQKARASMFQTNAVVGTTSVNSVEETITYTVAGVEKTLTIPANSTLSDVASLMNETGDMSAKMLKVSDTEYKLSVMGLETGADNALLFTAEGTELVTSIGLTDTTNTLQEAQNLKFSYNGVDMERNTNTVEDIIYGVSIEIASEGSADVEIQPDYQTVLDNINSFVSAYNELNTLVKANTTGSADGDALFRTNREVYNLMSSINSALFDTSAGLNNTTVKNMVDFGFSKNQDGTLSFDDSKVEDYLLGSFEEITKLFANPEKGIFTKLNEKLDNVTNVSASGSLDVLNKSVETENTRITDLKEKTQARLDKQYAMMEQRFAAFDALISKMNAGFDSLKLQIEQSVAQNTN